MNFEQAKLDIEQWIVDFVEKPNPLLNNWPPCPYARHARLNQQVDIRSGCFNPIDDTKQVVLGRFEVVVYVYDRGRWSADQFNELVQTANISYLAQQGLIALADHPDDVETVAGVVMNQGMYAIVFVQDLNKLNLFAEMLAKKDFYKDWPEEYLEVLFAGRADPRL